VLFVTLVVVVSSSAHLQLVDGVKQFVNVNVSLFRQGSNDSHLLDTLKNYP